MSVFPRGGAICRGRVDRLAMGRRGGVAVRRRAKVITCRAVVQGIRRFGPGDPPVPLIALPFERVGSADPLALVDDGPSYRSNFVQGRRSSFPQRNTEANRPSYSLLHWALANPGGRFQLRLLSSTAWGPRPLQADVSHFCKREPPQRASLTRVPTCRAAPLSPMHDDANFHSPSRWDAIPRNELTPET